MCLCTVLQVFVGRYLMWVFLIIIDGSAFDMMWEKGGLGWSKVCGSSRDLPGAVQGGGGALISGVGGALKRHGNAVDRDLGLRCPLARIFHGKTRGSNQKHGITDGYCGRVWYFKGATCNSRFYCSFFSSFRRAECIHLPRYQSIEVNRYICSSDALNMDALNS